MPLFFSLILLLWVPCTDDWHNLEKGLALAKSSQQPVLVYFGAPWCGPCQTMETEVFPGAAPLLDRFVRVKIRFDDHDTLMRIGNRNLTPFEWARHLGITATPGFAILAPNGRVITHITGAMHAKDFNRLLAYVATEAYKHATFEAYLKNHG